MTTSKQSSHSAVRMLCEGGIMLAAAFVLSLLQFWKMYDGGGIDFGMLPILLFAVRWGVGPGLVVGFADGVLQFMQAGGIAIGWQSIIGDYLVAFTVLGLADLFSKPFKSRAAGVCVGTAVVCLLRFVCSFLSGYIVWKDYDYAVEWLTNFEWGANFINSMGQDALCWFYSFVYNLSYMLPETILTVIGALILYKAMPKLFARQA